MRAFRLSCAAAFLTVAGGLPCASLAAPGALEPEAGAPQAATPAIGAPLVEHRLDVEMTVRNWVLCASRPFAETLVHAREAGPDAAARALADLVAARSCGRFAEMQVILQEPLYEALLASGGQAKVYGALVNISGAWASAFVVYGGLPDE